LIREQMVLPSRVGMWRPAGAGLVSPSEDGVDGERVAVGGHVEVQRRQPFLDRLERDLAVVQVNDADMAMMGSQSLRGLLDALAAALQTVEPSISSLPSEYRQAEGPPHSRISAA
jgi:hypothetical protein